MCKNSRVVFNRHHGEGVVKLHVVDIVQAEIFEACLHVLFEQLWSMKCIPELFESRCATPNGRNIVVWDTAGHTRNNIKDASHSYFV